ncbi:MAG: hypothetical protein ACK53Y_06020, partial [bacterium]
MSAQHSCCRHHPPRYSLPSYYYAALLLITLANVRTWTPLLLTFHVSPISEKCSIAVCFHTSISP